MTRPNTPKTIAIIGLGYVGLPLAVAFGRTLDVIGYDISSNRIRDLKKNRDKTHEVDNTEIKAATNLTFTDRTKDLIPCDTYIVTVPTPVDDRKQPDLTLLKSACETIGKVLSRGNIVIFESTVFPGATEEICVPLLEQASGLIFNTDFFAGYSPERINPGDKQHRLADIMKVTSGSTPDVARIVDALYSSIIKVGTYLAPDIKTAEAAKVIENVQRDVNIALINELAVLFEKLDIDTNDVLEAAGTKWNFLPFRPGLVGGHCIGVDPYYLTYKAEQLGHRPEMILAGRRINDSMSDFVTQKLVAHMKAKSISILNAKVLILGFTFKENCPDIRNTKVYDLVIALERCGAEVSVFDPWVDNDVVKAEYDRTLLDKPALGKFDAIILAVPHREFLDQGVEAIRKFGRRNHIFFDMKSCFQKNESDLRI